MARLARVLSAFSLRQHGHSACALGSACTSGREYATQAASTMAARLQSRSVIRIEGEESIDFLQGMTTNDMHPLQQPGEGPVYAAIMTPKGKMLHDLFVYRVPGEPVALLADVDAGGREHALRWLLRFRLRRHVQISDASETYAVWAHFGGSPDHHHQQQQQQQQHAAVPASPSGWWPDPRLPQLGSRAVLPAEQDAATSAGAALEVGEEEYRRLRYALGVAEGDAEMPPDKAGPLEYNLDVLNGVSYTKGCYVGQERNSFTHYRGVLRKRLMPVRVVGGAAGLEAGAEVLDGPGGRGIGSVAAVCGDVGLAHLRLAPALAAAANRTPLPVAGISSQVVPHRPSWWLESWGKEEEGAG